MASKILDEKHENQRIYYSINKEKLRAYQKSWRRLNHIKIAMQAKNRKINNRKRHRQYKKDNYEKHREKFLLNRRACYVKNRTKVLAVAKKHYADNRVQMRISGRAYNKTYREQHPSSRRIESQRRRAVKAKAKIGNQNVILQWQSSWRSKRIAVCYWCLKSFNPKHCHTDHIIPLSKGGAHSIENLCVSCGNCNLSKSAKQLSDWNSSIEQPILI